MTVTYTLSDAAVWSDGSPMSCGRLRVHVAGLAQHPRVDHHHRLRPDRSRSRPAPPTRKSSSTSITPFAAWKTLFDQPILQGLAVRGLQRRDRRLQRRLHVRQQRLHDDRVDARADRVRGQPGLHRPEGPQDRRRSSSFPPRTAPTLLKSGTVDFIFPQCYTGLDQELADPNIDFAAEGGGSYEGLYFQQDDNCVPRREPFVRLRRRRFPCGVLEVDRHRRRVPADLRPVRAGSAAADLRPGRPRPVLRPGVQPTPTTPRAPTQILTDAGWAKNADGFWAKRRRGPGDPLDGQHRQHPP